MKKIFKGLVLSFLALALVVGVGASSASADLTVAALAVTSSGALTLDAAAASNTIIGSAQVAGTITIGAATGTGAINLGISTAAQTINIGATNSVQTIHIGDHATPANAITIGGAASTVGITGAVTVTGNASFTNGAAVYADSGTVDDQCTGANAALNLATGNYFVLDMTGAADCAVSFTGGTAGGIYILNLTWSGTDDFTFSGLNDSNTLCGAGPDADSDTAMMVVRAINATTVNVLSCTPNVVS